MTTYYSEIAVEYEAYVFYICNPEEYELSFPRVYRFNIKKKKSYMARSMDSFKGIKIAVSDIWAFLLYAKYHSSYF